MFLDTNACPHCMPIIWILRCGIRHFQAHPELFITACDRGGEEPTYHLTVPAKCQLAAQEQRKEFASRRQIPLQFLLWSSSQANYSISSQETVARFDWQTFKIWSSSPYSLQIGLDQCINSVLHNATPTKYQVGEIETLISTNKHQQCWLISGQWWHHWSSNSHPQTNNCPMGKHEPAQLTASTAVYLLVWEKSKTTVARLDIWFSSSSTNTV